MSKYFSFNKNSKKQAVKKTSGITIIPEDCSKKVTNQLELNEPNASSNENDCEEKNYKEVDGAYANGYSVGALRKRAVTRITPNHPSSEHLYSSCSELGLYSNVKTQCWIKVKLNLLCNVNRRDDIALVNWQLLFIPEDNDKTDVLVGDWLSSAQQSKCYEEIHKLMIEKKEPKENLIIKITKMKHPESLCSMKNDCTEEILTLDSIYHGLPSKVTFSSVIQIIDLQNFDKIYLDCNIDIFHGKEKRLPVCVLFFLFENAHVTKQKDCSSDNDYKRAPDPSSSMKSLMSDQQSESGFQYPLDCQS